MSDWIIDRPPTEADADCDGEVAVKKRPGSDANAYFHWSFVKPGMVWRRMSHWSAAEQTPEPAAEPAARAMQSRRFVSISRTVHDHCHTLDAIADDGTAWWKDADHTEWRQLSPLPARELPTEPAF
jgi:hypothetical protein